VKNAKEKPAENAKKFKFEGGFGVDAGGGGGLATFESLVQRYSDCITVYTLISNEGTY